MKNQDQSRLVAVFSGQRMEAEIIKGMLEANGILSMLKDESLGGVISPYLSTENRGIKVSPLTSAPKTEASKSS